MANYIKKIGNKEIKVDWSNIDNKIDFIRSVYIQDEEPVDVPEGSLWIDTNDVLGPFPVSEVYEAGKQEVESRIAEELEGDY